MSGSSRPCVTPKRGPSSVGRISRALFSVTDTETSGLDQATSELLEIGAVFCDARGKIYDTFETLVAPTKPLTADNSAIHGLIDEDFADAPGRDIALQRFDDKLFRWTRGADLSVRPILVAHFFEFDKGFIPTLAERGGLCTKRLAYHLVIDAPNVSNLTLRYHFRDVAREPHIRALGDAHRAISDATVTAAIFPKLIDLYFAAGHPDDVDALIAFAESPILIKRMWLGKHYGKPFEEVPLDYFYWALDTLDLDIDQRFTLEHHREEQKRKRLEFLTFNAVTNVP